jgi:hypothetical protein
MNRFVQFVPPEQLAERYIVSSKRLSGHWVNGCEFRDSHWAWQHAMHLSRSFDCPVWVYAFKEQHRRILSWRLVGGVRILSNKHPVWCGKWPPEW